MRLHSIVTSSAVLAALCSMLMGGCGAGTQGDEGASPTLRDGELNENAAVDMEGKITICHVPPGNPANAHTLVVGASAWNGHRHHKGDHLGACEGESDGGVPPTEDGGTSQPDAGTPTPDAGTPGPTCAPEGAACGADVVCCDGRQCQDGTCQPVLN
jgi:hypothetical protein